MVGSIDPRCETLRGTHWPKKGRLVVWNSRRGSHLGQRSTDRINRPDIWMQAIRSDRQKTLVARGPSTYGSLLSQGRHSFLLLAERRAERMPRIDPDDPEFAREEFQFLQRERQPLVLGMAVDVGI